MDLCPTVEEQAPYGVSRIFRCCRADPEQKKIWQQQGRQPPAIAGHYTDRQKHRQARDDGQPKRR
jgi:hypothetical protein